MIENLIEELNIKIEEKKSRGIKTLFLTSYKISGEEKLMIRKHFEAKGYSVTLDTCKRGLTDIIIRF